jgi:methionine synthase I (cobalamin-dependent)
MHHPCVELYFEVEVGALDIRIWLKTDNFLQEGAIPISFYDKIAHIKAGILGLKCSEKEKVVQYLESMSGIAAFQVCYRHDMNRVATIVYREWP